MHRHVWSSFKIYFWLNNCYHSCIKMPLLIIYSMGKHNFIILIFQDCLKHGVNYLPKIIIFVFNFWNIKLGTMYNLHGPWMDVYIKYFDITGVLIRFCLFPPVITHLVGSGPRVNVWHVGSVFEEFASFQLHFLLRCGGRTNWSTLNWLVFFGKWSDFWCGRLSVRIVSVKNFILSIYQSIKLSLASTSRCCTFKITLK